jgi:hypothetical protein
MSLLAILLFIGTMALSLWGNDPIPASLQQVRPVARERNSRELNSKAKNQPAVGRFDPEPVIGDQKGREDLGDVQTQKQRTLSWPFLGRR